MSDYLIKNKNISKELASLLSSIEYKVKLEKSNFLFQQGEEVNELYIILSGRIQIGKMSADGRELSLRIATSGDIVGELALYTDDVKYLLNAKAMEETEVGVIKKKKLEETLLENHDLSIEFIKLMSQTLRRDQTKFRDLVLHGKKGALFSTLIRLSNSYGVKEKDGISIQTVMTNQELANFCGTSRESVNRMLNDLKRKEIISMENNQIKIHDLQYLKDEINCENCPIVLCSID